MSIRSYEHYKPSEVEWLGDVPNHWEVVRLRTLFEIKKRIAGTADFDVLSITQRGIKVKDTESNDGQLSMDYAKYQLVYSGDFAMNHMDLLTGYVDLSKQLGVTSPDYRVFTLRDQSAVARYFLYLLQNAYHQKLFYPFGQGSSQLGRWRLPTDQFNEFRFPRPPLQEQVSIVEFLDSETAKIDALVEEQKHLIELLKEKRQAVITQAVTKGLNPNAPMKPSGVEWLGDVPAHWETPMIKRFTTFSYGDSLASEFRVEGSIPVFGSNGPVGVHDKANTTAPCILVGRKGSHGAVNWSDCAAFAIDTVYYIDDTCTKVDLRWLYWTIQSAGLSSLSQDTGVPGLSREIAYETRLPFPPTAEQLSLANFLDSKVATMTALETESEMAVQILKERRNALISAAVTGKIDVRGIAAKQEAA